jgi:hypothetical protein
MYEVTDFDGRRRSFPLRRVVEIGFPTGRVHDNGFVRLDDGSTITFGNGDHARRLNDALTQEADSDPRR